MLLPLLNKVFTYLLTYLQATYNHHLLLLIIIINDYYLILLASSVYFTTLEWSAATVTFLAIGDFCHLLITFTNSLDQDQDQQNSGLEICWSWSGSKLLDTLRFPTYKSYVDKISNSFWWFCRCRRWTRAAEQWRQYHKDITTLTKWLTEAEKKLADIKQMHDYLKAENAYTVSDLKTSWNCSLHFTSASYVDLQMRFR